jgi:hypothetical protein
LCEKLVYEIPMYDSYDSYDSYDPYNTSDWD